MIQHRHIVFAAGRVALVATLAAWLLFAIPASSDAQLQGCGPVCYLWNSFYLVVGGISGEQAYIGGDGNPCCGDSAPDVQLGSYNASVKWVALWNVAGSYVMGLLAHYGWFNGDLRVGGLKKFIQAHPTDPTKEIAYVSLEGPEAGTYTRGTVQLVNGEAVIMLPDHFAIVTSEEGLTVQLTPVGEWLQLYVVEKSTTKLVIKEAQGKNGKFDYLVQGVRKGYENYQPVEGKPPLPRSAVLQQNAKKDAEVIPKQNY